MSGSVSLQVFICAFYHDCRFFNREERLHVLGVFEFVVHVLLILSPSAPLARDLPRVMLIFAPADFIAVVLFYCKTVATLQDFL